MQPELQETFWSCSLQYEHYTPKFANYSPLTLVNKVEKVTHYTEQQWKSKKHFIVLPTVKAF